MSKKRIVSIEDQFTGVLWGIMAQVKEYQLSWHLNRTLGFDLKRADDMEIIHKKKNRTSLFSFFRYESELDKRQVFVISNKHLGEFLIPEVQQADYFLMIKGEVSGAEEETLFSKIKNIPIVQLIVKLEYHQLKSKHNLLVD
ncbi:MAG: IPExxxVDY family protein [Chitinophagaceae bacterium]|nr:IPExxxVDY family protein [Chitinophagaceae bacterium]